MQHGPRTPSRESGNDPYAALRYPEFKHYLITRFAVIFALTMQFVIIEWHVYELTRDPWSLGLIGLSEVVPALSMALFAGYIVDRREKRGMMLKCVIAYIVLGLALFTVTSPQIIQQLSKAWAVNIVYALVFFGGVIRAFYGPSSFSMFALLLPREKYQNAATWSSSAWQVGAVMGPAMGGLCIRWFDEHWSMLVVVLCLLVPLLSLVFIQPRPVYQKIQEPIVQSLTKGVRFVFHNKLVLTAMSLDMFAVLFGGATALLPVFARDILKVGEIGFGMLRAAPAVGALMTMFFLAYRPVLNHTGKKMMGAVFGFGLCIIVFGISDIFIVSLLALLLSGIMDGISVIIRQTILQLETPDEMRGRVAAVNTMFVGSSNELGAFESGLAARLIGTVPAVVFGGSMTLLVVIAAWWKGSSMRKLEFRNQG